MSKNRQERQKNAKTRIKKFEETSKIAVRIKGKLYWKDENMYYIGLKDWKRVAFTYVEKSPQNAKER